VKLDINTKGKNFTISGGLTGLVPGLWQSLDLSLTNPNKKPLSVTNLSVTLKSVAQASGAVLPCTLSDYAVVQYSGPYPLVLPGSSTSTLERTWGGVPPKTPDPAHQQARTGSREQPGWLQVRRPVAVVFRIGTGELT